MTAPAHRVLVRPTTPDDLDFVVATERAAENAAFVLQWPREQHADAVGRADLLHWIVEALPDRRRVGYIILAGVGGADRSVELRRMVVAEKGRGFGRAALRLVRDYAFRRLGAHRLWLDVVEDNVAARRLYESEGFVIEGVMRECIRRGERYESLVLMSMLEWEHEG